MEQKKAQLIEIKGNTNKRRRTDTPQIEMDVLYVARTTRSLDRTCNRLCLTEKQVLFFGMIQLADLVLRPPDGLGVSIRKLVGQAAA